MSGGITIELDGVEEWGRALDREIDKITQAAYDGVLDAMAVIHRAIADMLRTTTHAEGTPTPSAPGEPPSFVTGNLVRSIQESGPYFESADVIAGLVGPSAVYARIQELGGDAGRNHATHLPARPYVAPAVELSKGAAHQALFLRVYNVMDGG